MHSYIQVISGKVSSNMLETLPDFSCFVVYVGIGAGFGNVSPNENESLPVFRQRME